MGKGIFMYKKSIVTLIFSTLFLAQSWADDKAAPGLPGVKAQKPIVAAPPPEPEPDQASNGSWKNFRVGNTDVSISGEITVDVGTAGSRSSGR